MGTINQLNLFSSKFIEDKEKNEITNIKGESVENNSFVEKDTLTLIKGKWRPCLVSKMDQVKVSSSVDQSVESTSYIEQFQKLIGEVVSIKELPKNSNDKRYNVYVHFETKGTTGIFYDTELSLV